MIVTRENKSIIDVECTLIGSFLFSEEGKKYFEENKIPSKLFVQKRINRQIIESMNKLLETGIQYNEEIIKRQLIDDMNIEEDKIDKLLRVFDNYKTNDLNTIKTFINILKKEYKINRYLQLADELKMEALKEKNNPSENDLKKFETKFVSFFEDISEEFPEEKRKEFNMSQGLRHLYKISKESVESGTKETISTGYRELNKLYNGGHVKGTYTIIAGRPAMGKTVYMINEAVESALDGTKVLFISIEMTITQIFQRIISKLTNIKAKKFMAPETLTEEEWERFREVASEVAGLFGDNFWVVEVSQLDVAEAGRIIRKYKKNYGIESVYIDYVQIMATKDGRPPEKESDYASISRGIAKLAKEEYIHITVGSQLKRDVEEREDKRPVPSDLRNSGAFEQDAARVVGLYRDDVYYGEESEEPNVLEYISLKDRFGRGRGAVESTIKFKIDVAKQSVYSSFSSTGK